MKTLYSILGFITIVLGMAFLGLLKLNTEVLSSFSNKQTTVEVKGETSQATTPEEKTITTPPATQEKSAADTTKTPTTPETEVRTPPAKPETTTSFLFTDGTIIHVDYSHSQLGRLFNLRQVMNFLNDLTIPPRTTISFNQTIKLEQAESIYMNGLAYNTDGYALAGGVCGAASSLAGEVDRLHTDLTRADDGGRHPASDHQTGGIYWNLPNVAVYFDGYKHTDLRITNTSETTSYQLQVAINYDSIWKDIGVDLNNWQASANRWSEKLDSQALIHQPEFQYRIKIVPTIR